MPRSAAFRNYEGVQLRLAHKHPTVIPVDQAGVPTYDELVLVVREDVERVLAPDPLSARRGKCFVGPYKTLPKVVVLRYIC